MYNKKPLKGVLTLVPTPFEKGDLDIQAFEENIKYLASSGMHGIVVASGAGELYTLSDEEFKSLVTSAKDSCGDMFCVIDCAYHNARTAVERAKFADQVGADCALVYPYHYSMPFTPAVYHEYFRMLTEATHNIGFMMLNDPRETKGVKISIELYSSLLEAFPRIVASVEDVSNASEMEITPITCIIEKFGGRISIFDRSEAGMFPAMALGCMGCLATYGLAIPKFLLKLYSECESKNWDDGLKDHQALVRYPSQAGAVGVNFPGRASDLFPGTCVVPIGYTHEIARRKYGTVFPGTAVMCKAMAEAAGRKVGNPRLPMLPPTSELREFARKWIADIEINAS